MFAIVGIDTERVTGLIINGLAVGGAFLSGYILSGAIAYFLDKWLTGGNAPQGLKRASKIIGGLVAAVLVALLLFGSGGRGNGGTGPGGGPTDQKGEGNGPGQPTTAPKVDPPLAPPPVTPPDPDAKVEKVTVKVLAGTDVKDAKYYLLEGDANAKTIDELFAKLKEKHAPPKKVVQVVPVYQANGGEETIGAAKLRRRGILEKITVE